MTTTLTPEEAVRRCRAVYCEDFRPGLGTGMVELRDGIVHGDVVLALHLYESGGPASLPDIDRAGVYPWAFRKFGQDFVLGMLKGSSGKSILGLTKRVDKNRVEDLSSGYVCGKAVREAVIDGKN